MTSLITSESSPSPGKTGLSTRHWLSVSISGVQCMMGWVTIVIYSFCRCLFSNVSQLRTCDLLTSSKTLVIVSNKYRGKCMLYIYIVGLQEYIAVYRIVRHVGVVDSATGFGSRHSRSKPGRFNCVWASSPYRVTAVRKLLTLTCQGGDCPSFTFRKSFALLHCYETWWLQGCASGLPTKIVFSRFYKCIQKENDSTVVFAGFAVVGIIHLNFTAFQFT